MKRMLNISWSLLIAITMIGCSESSLVDSDDLSSDQAESSSFASKKGGNGGGNGGNGGGADPVPLYVTLDPSSFTPSTGVAHLVDLNGGGRIGDGAAVYFNYDPELGFDDSRATATSCQTPYDYSFDLLEVDMSGGQVTRIHLWGGDENGHGLKSGWLDVGPFPEDEVDLVNGWDMKLNMEIDMKPRKGKGVTVCTVAIGTVKYSPDKPVIP